MRGVSLSPDANHRRCEERGVLGCGHGRRTTPLPAALARRQDPRRLCRPRRQQAGDRVHLLATHQEQLATAMAQLVELARKLATIAETQTADEPDPPRRKLGWAWGWFLRN